MSDDLHKGDRVSWNTSQGRTQGEVGERRTGDFVFGGQHFTASDEHPAYIVESDKSGDRAAHKRSALQKLT
jgi:hypothetical protein